MKVFYRKCTIKWRQKSIILTIFEKKSHKNTVTVTTVGELRNFFRVPFFLR